MLCSNHTISMSHSSGITARHTPHTMNHELLKAAATGDKSLLAQVLGLAGITNGKQGGKSCLKGVTSEGNTVLHITAGRGYLDLVDMICRQDASLIKARNNMLNTPLICAARGGHGDVVSYLIEHGSVEPEDDEPVPRARNSEGATAMHEAVRNGHEAVLQKLMSADGGLAAVVDGKGLSPLYLAAALGRADMVEILIIGSPGGVKSPAYYAGPDGQTALHAAVLVNKEMAESLWCWEPTLAKKVDNSGNTALHHAASAGKFGVVKLLLNDSSLAYIPDTNGLFPVHTAAKMGKIGIIDQLMETCPNCDELVDNMGRNALHCAIEHKKEKVVQHICKNPMFRRMMNARDSEGNTPLHLAVKHGRDKIAILLMQDIKVNLSIMNNDGLTPLDIAINELDHGYTYPLNPAVIIVQCLVWCGAHRSPRRRDEYLNERSTEDSEKELSKYTNLTQNGAIGSVLIATVTFAAPFALPGIYIPDGMNGETPVLARRPAFKAFIVSNSLAFLCSTVATCLLMYAGQTTVHPRYCSHYHLWSSNLLHVGVLLVIATYAFGVHLTLNPPGGWLAAIVCLMACVSVIFTHPGIWWPMVLAKPIWTRFGLKGLTDVLLGPRPIPCLKLLLSRTPWLNLFKILVTLVIFAMIVVTFLLDISVEPHQETTCKDGQSLRNYGVIGLSYPT